MAKANSDRVKEYRLLVVEGQNLELATLQLQFEVNKLINERGFQPLGAPIYAADNKVLQAVVLYVGPQQ